MRPSSKDGQPGLGLAIDVNPSPNEKPNQVVYMKTKYDIDFLMELAKSNGYQIYLEDENDTPTLFFGQSEDLGKPVYQLEWGKSLISFRPTLSTSDQVGQVDVRGWDRKANRQIEESYTLQDLWKEQAKSQTEIARADPNRAGVLVTGRTWSRTSRPIQKRKPRCGEGHPDRAQQKTDSS